MNTTELLTVKNINRFDDISVELAGAYKVAFAGEPWYEVSKCPNDACPELFSSCEVGSECVECKTDRIEAYDTEKIVTGWRSMITNDNAFFEVDSLDAQPYRATIARPTSPSELFDRKYPTIEQMRQWLADELPAELVYIEDTFANRNIMPSGNLAGRRNTMGRIGTMYSGLLVVTRTINPAVITATARDVGDNATLSIGTLGVGQDCKYTIEIGADVPDERTIIRIDTKGMQ